MNVFKRRYICIILIFTGFILLFTQAAIASSVNVLSKGMQGQEVSSLQTDLKKLGYLETAATGYFGEATEAAVIRFQKDHGMSPDGVVGVNTSGRVKEFLGKPGLRKGMSGKEVSTIQTELKKLKFFSQKVTGYFGEATETSVRNFQKHYGINVTGIVGVLTYVKIDTLLQKGNFITIVIDSGHGGIDKGTSKGKAVESFINLDMAKKLKEYAGDAGFNVVMTRSKDIALDSMSKIPGTRELKDLNARTKIINSSKASLFVSIHVNSCPNSTSPTGSVVFYNDKLPKSKTLARYIQAALNNVYVSSYTRDSHSSQKANFYVLRNSDIPGVLVETGYISNTYERTMLLTDSFKNKIAKAILAGIENSDLY